ncbi:FtsK/SpoIIIE domain-containing protein [Klugiella xanthotipulae]|nr:FtsK/SpoIIIE domain-containing protein [Klugiella xanthotipulae]
MMLIVSGGTGSDCPVELTADATARVADVARLLILGHPEGNPLAEVALADAVPLTLRVRRPGETTVWALDPASPLERSGVRSGCWVQPIPEGEHHPGDTLLLPPLGRVEVLNGPQAGVRFSVIEGSNSIGRDASARIRLRSESVSRRHAVIEADSSMTVRDAGSVNGITVDGWRVTEAELAGAHIIRLGDISLSCTPVHARSRGAGERERAATVACVRSPRTDIAAESVAVDLPRPPAAVTPQRVPLVAVLAPVLMGGALFALTSAPMSLIFVALSPVVLVATWLDTRLTARRVWRTRMKRFWTDLGEASATLAAARRAELAARDRACLGGESAALAIADRTSAVWSREPQEDVFLRLRLGMGELASDTRVHSPARGEERDGAWDEVDAVAREFRTITPVPVTELLGQCGSLGITGDPRAAADLLRSVVLQLAGLHSPAELVLAGVGMHWGRGAELCVIEPAEWLPWLEWLPHADSARRLLRARPVAGDADSVAELVAGLEACVAARMAADRSRERRPAVVVVVASVTPAECGRLVAVAERGAGVGIHLIWVAPSVDCLPAACRTYVEVAGEGGSVTYGKTRRRVPLVSVEALAGPQFEVAVRRLAPLVEVGSREAAVAAALPRAVALRELLAADTPTGADADWIIASWARPSAGLGAIVGVGSAGPFGLDLRSQGPHALVGGTTGSGKSEFLQTWIMSLAARHGPDRLTFLLIDYKGGTAFAECTSLPHTVGLVTDLTPQLVQRALTSLSAELRYRERLLAEAGAKDLPDLESRNNGVAPPALVIVVDELAALAREVPEFLEGLVDIAQRGRSLGLHLVLATQRPAGVVTDNLRANITLRVALRVADERDSLDVVGVRDAAHIAGDTPGRAVVAVGSAPIAHLQTAYVGGRAVGPAARPAVAVRELGLGPGHPWCAPDPAADDPPGAPGPRDIERLRDAIVCAAQRTGALVPRRVWCDALPDILALEGLPTDARGVPLGLADYPAEQRQSVFTIRLDEVGNVAVMGTGGSGKTTALRSCAAALSVDVAADPVHIYALDYAGGALAALAALPTVGAVVTADDDEGTRRLLRQLATIIDDRAAQFSTCHAASLSEYRRRPGQSGEPRIVLLIDGFLPLWEAAEAEGVSCDLLRTVMAEGRAVGVHVMLTADRAGGIPSPLLATIQQRIVLRLASEGEYLTVGVTALAGENVPPGRARSLGASPGVEVQIGVYGGQCGSAEQAGALRELGARLHTHGISAAPPVPRMPERIPLESLPARGSGRATIGLTSESLQPISLPTTGVCVVAGPPASGRTTTIACVLAAMACTRVLSAVRLSATRGEGSSVWRWVASAEGPEELTELADALCARLGHTPASPVDSTLPGWLLTEASPAPATVALPLEWPPRGTTGVIVIDDVGECEGSGAEASLAALLRVARRAGVCVLVECDPATAAGAWQVYAELRAARTGIVLQPDDADGPGPLRATLPRSRRRDYSPGSGFLVDAGRVTRIQVAVPSVRPCESAVSVRGGERDVAGWVERPDVAVSVVRDIVDPAPISWVTPEFSPRSAGSPALRSLVDIGDEWDYARAGTFVATEHKLESK